MKDKQQLHAEQSALPPLRSYFVVWMRPHGSYLWTTLVEQPMDRETANNFAKARVDDKTLPVCDCVVRITRLQRVPVSEGAEPVALLVTELGPDALYYGKGHAR